jgi:hypothetical protein
MAVFLNNNPSCTSAVHTDADAPFTPPGELISGPEKFTANAGPLEGSGGVGDGELVMYRSSGGEPEGIRLALRLQVRQGRGFRECQDECAHRDRLEERKTSMKAAMSKMRRAVSRSGFFHYVCARPNPQA